MQHTRQRINFAPFSTFKFFSIVLLIVISTTSEALELPNGSWRSECKIGDVKATCQSTWFKGHSETQFIQNYVISTPSNSKVIFSATGTYIFNNNEVSGLWIDSTGSEYKLTGIWSDNRLEVVWVNKGLDIGRSVYQFGENSLTATDTLLKGDQFVPFQHVVYTEKLATER